MVSFSRLTSSIYLITTFIIGLATFSARAAPGDILFQDNFNSNLNNWTIDNSGGGDASLGNETSNSGRSLRLRWDQVSIASDAFDAAVPGAQLSFWVRRGADAFSEDTDADEDLAIEYQTAAGIWITIDTLLGAGTNGEILTPTYTLPLGALHANLSIRFRHLGGSGDDFDYWHIDDVEVEETGGGTGFTLNSCDEFENGLINWTTVAGTGNAGVNSDTANSGTQSLFTRWGDVTVTSLIIDTQSVNSLELSAWIRRGDDSFSENPETNENLTIEYFDNTNTWIALETFPGAGTQGEIFIRNYTLPATAFHANFRIRISQAAGSGSDFDYWHIDDVCVTDPLPTAYYPFDEASYSGAAGEVTDDTGNGNDGTGQGSASTIDPGQVCRGVNIPDNSSAAIIDAVDTGLDLDSDIGNTGTISFWYKSNGAWNGNGARTLFDATSRVFGNSNDKYFFLLLDNNGRLNFELEDTDDDDFQMQSAAFTFAADTWVHIAVTWDYPRDSLQLFVNGNLEQTATPDTNGSVADLGNLFIGDNSSTYTVSGNQGDSADGVIDELYVYSYVASTALIQSNRDATHTCPILVTRIDILHDGSGINCLREAIVVTAVDGSDNTITDYTGTVDLSLISNFGDWFISDESNLNSDPPVGTLTDTGTTNDGAASYEFVAADGGTVILYLENVQAETTNINATDGTVNDDDSEGNITFRPVGFVATPNPITTQIAGRPFTLTLTAAGQTPSRPECGVIEEYTGNRPLQFWSTYSTPAIGTRQVSIESSPIATSEASSAVQTINFSAGVANLAVQYDDVGTIAIAVKDNLGIGDPVTGTIDEIIGGLLPFIVRPFAYDIQIAGSPVAIDASGSVFATAGSSFNQTIRSILWETADDTDANGIPDSGATLSDNGITPNIVNITGNIDTVTPTAQVVTNSNGTLGTTTLSFSSFDAVGSANEGTATISQSWDEVGILTIDAQTLNFLSSGDSITGQRANIGRFVPNEFNFSITTDFAAQCASFSYAGFADGTNAGLDKDGQQANIIGSLEALNIGSVRTLNYDGVFAKLEAGTLTASAFNNDTASAATGTLNSSLSALNFNFGLTALNLTNIHYQYETLAAPFDLRVDLTALDSDTISGNFSSTTVLLRLGRLQLTNTYGPEDAALEMPIAVEYFDGTNWLTNTLDACTTYNSANIIYNSFTAPLTGADVSTSVTSSTLVNGIAPPGTSILFFNSSTNQGEANVSLDLSAQGWLAFDWNGDNNNQNPSAIVGFGRFRGSDRVIYWREQ